MNDICDIGYSNIIFGGDMNVDFKDKNLQVDSTLMSYVQDTNLKFVDDKSCDGTYTTVTGTFVPTYFRSQERKYNRWNFRSLVLSFPGTFAPWNIRSRERK